MAPVRSMDPFTKPNLTDNFTWLFLEGEESCYAVSTKQ